MLDARRVLSSLEPLLVDASERVPLLGPGKSGAPIERVVIDGRAHVLKRLDSRGDWTLRASGVPGGAVRVLWERGLLDRLPATVTHPIVAVAHDPAEPAVTDLLMDDVTECLVPATDELLTPAQQERFLDHMADLHAHFWEAGPEIDVVSPVHRYTELSPSMAAAEEGRPDRHVVPPLVAEGWGMFPEIAPAAATVVMPLLDDPAPLISALAQTPQTFVHGDWKLDNMGSDPEGRTILLDWQFPGRAAGLHELAWYLAINCRRLPTSKEEAIALYRDGLLRRGIDTSGWWDRQLGLSLLGGLVLFGWDKAFGGYDDELAWWEEQAVRARGLL